MSTSKRHLYFLIPEERHTEHGELLAELVTALPETLDRFTGTLNRLEPNTTVHQEFGYMYPEMRLITRAAQDSHIPSMCQFMAGEHPPAFVGFEAHVTPSILPARMIAAHFIKKGYRGKLRAWKHVQGEPNAEHVLCSIKHRPWNGLKEHPHERGGQPARVRLEWDEGKSLPRDVKLILAAFKRLGLKEHHPKSAPLHPIPSPIAATETRAP